MRCLLLVPLATLLCGCPPPLYSVLYRESPAPQGLFYRATSCSPADSGRVLGTVACQPDEFNRLAASGTGARADVKTYDGRRVRGESIRVERDTAFVGTQAVPMALVGQIHLAGRGGRFDVFGWPDAPHAANVLVPSDAPREPRPGSPYGPGCATSVPAAVPYVRSFVRCVTPAELTARAGAAWVREVEVQFAGDGAVRGRDLTVSDGAAVVDGQSVALADVDRILLRHPYGPLRPARRTLKATAYGAAWGVLVGSAFALSNGDADTLWRGAAIGGGVAGIGALAVNLLAPNDAARDVTYVSSLGARGH